MTPTVTPALLVLGAGRREFREYVFAEYDACQPLVLLDADPPAWARRYTQASVSVDLTDTHTATLAAKRYAAQHPIAGVTTCLENHVELAAHIAQDLGLPGPAPHAVAACRDKARTRRLLAANQVPSARSLIVTSEAEAVMAAATVGYPVVVKPRAMADSAGVRRADRPSDIPSCYIAATTEGVFGPECAVPGVLVEEYLHGPEISVEAVVLAPGQLHIAAITRKELGPVPGFQEIGHIIDAADPLLNDTAIHQVAAGALNTVGITTGVLHIEMRLTPTGPRIIEINARLGGDLIPFLVHLATGVSLPRVAADLACGRRPELTPTRSQAASVAFRYPVRDGRILRISNPHTSPRPWLKSVVLTHRAGDSVSAPPRASVADRLAHAVTTGSNRIICRDRARQAVDELHVDMTAPMARTTHCVR